MVVSWLGGRHDYGHVFDWSSYARCYIGPAQFVVCSSNDVRSSTLVYLINVRSALGDRLDRWRWVVRIPVLEGPSETYYWDAKTAFDLDSAVGRVLDLARDRFVVFCKTHDIKMIHTIDLVPSNHELRWGLISDGRDAVLLRLKGYKLVDLKELRFDNEIEATAGDHD